MTLPNPDKSAENPNLSAILADLAEEGAPAARVDLWPTLRRRLPEEHLRFRQQTGRIMKMALVPALAILLLAAVVAIPLLVNVTPVSAQLVLQRAVEARSRSVPIQGIRHFRTLTTYFDESPKVGGMIQRQMLADEYYDYQAGRIRWVFTNPATGEILDAYSFDGVYTLSASQDADNHRDGKLIVLRSQENQDALVNIVLDDANTNDQLFYQMNVDDPTVVLLGKESWPNGRKVYVLESHRPADDKGSGGKPTQFHQLVFDAKTYQLLQVRQGTSVDGQEKILSTETYLVNEVLPANSPVPWDMSDLGGILIEDAPPAEP